MSTCSHLEMKQIISKDEDKRHLIWQLSQLHRMGRTVNYTEYRRSRVWGFLERLGALQEGSGPFHAKGGSPPWIGLCSHYSAIIPD